MPFVTLVVPRITVNRPMLLHTHTMEGSVFLRLDFFVVHTYNCFDHPGGPALLGRLNSAAINSAIVCLIGFRNAQFGFIPANLFCIALYGVNVRRWRKSEVR